MLSRDVHMSQSQQDKLLGVRVMTKLCYTHAQGNNILKYHHISEHNHRVDNDTSKLFFKIIMANICHMNGSYKYMTKRTEK